MEADLIECGDNDLIAAMEMSLIDDMRAKQAKKAEERKAKAAAKKAAAKAEAAKAMEGVDEELIKLTVLTTQEQVFEDSWASSHVQGILAKRLRDSENKLSEHTIAILKEIHGNFTKIPLEYLSLPDDEPLLAEMEITKESL